jgi:hypothetical protein
MRKLLNYSIETDQLVWLEFSDGESLRVTFQQIPDLLSGPELHKVSRAIKLRQDFFRNNLPKKMVLLAAVGLASFAAVQTKAVAGILNHIHPGALAPAPDVHRAGIISSPTPTPTITPPVTPPPAVSPLPASPVPLATPATAVPSVPAAPPAPALQVPEVVRPVVHALDTILPRLPKL